MVKIWKVLKFSKRFQNFTTFPIFSKSFENVQKIDSFLIFLYHFCLVFLPWATDSLDGFQGTVINVDGRGRVGFGLDMETDKVAAWRQLQWFPIEIVFNGFGDSEPLYNKSQLTLFLDLSIEGSEVDRLACYDTWA